MVCLNTQHSNHSVPAGTFGGSMCTCRTCAENRKPEEPLNERDEVYADMNEIVSGQRAEIKTLQAKLKEMKATARKGCKWMKGHHCDATAACQSIVDKAVGIEEGE